MEPPITLYPEPHPAKTLFGFWLLFQACLMMTPAATLAHEAYDIPPPLTQYVLVLALNHEPLIEPNPNPVTSV